MTNGLSHAALDNTPERYARLGLNLEPEEPHTALKKAEAAVAVDNAPGLSMLTHLLDAILDEVAVALESGRRTVIRTVFPGPPY